MQMSGRTISISIRKYKHSFSFDFWNNNDVETRALHDNKSCILLKWRAADCRKWKSCSFFYFMWILHWYWRCENSSARSPYLTFSHFISVILYVCHFIDKNSNHLIFAWTREIQWWTGINAHTEFYCESFICHHRFRQQTRWKATSSFNVYAFKLITI